MLEFQTQKDSITSKNIDIINTIEDVQGVINNIQQKYSLQSERLGKMTIKLNENRSLLESLNREIVESRTILQSTQRVVSQNDGVSTDQQSILNETGVLGVLTAHLIVEEQHQDAFLAALGADAEMIIVDHSCNVSEMLSQVNGTFRILQLETNWKSKDVSIIRDDLRYFGTIDGADWAMFALHTLLGRTSEFDEEKSVSESDEAAAEGGC